MKRTGLAFLILFALLVLDSRAKGLTPGNDLSRFKSAASDSVEPQHRVHRGGNINLCISNWGYLGSQTRRLYESTGCLFCDHPDSEVKAPSLEFPANSGLEYLYEGALWIGGVVEGETLVSVGAEGRWWCYECYEMTPATEILERVWLGDQECITTFTDTFVHSGDIWNLPDNRLHIPLNVEIIQKSYSWALPPFVDFVILDYSIRNIGQKPISDIYLGFYMDVDIDRFSESRYQPCEAYQDDLTGFLRNYVDSSGETTEVNIAWAADNNGNPYRGGFTEKSPNGIIGIKLLDCSNSNPQISYNWWSSNSHGYPYDWSPWLKANQEKWEQINPYGSGIYFPDSAMGTPGGDISKYFLMSNGEVDYDQIFTAVFSENDTSWVPADRTAFYLVEGWGTRFTYSFGPFDLAPGDSIFAVIALVAGENFHTDPLNYLRNLPRAPDKYFENLDFSDLVHNAQMALEAYESFVKNKRKRQILPEDFSLKQNYPNPFNAGTTILFTIPSPPVNSSQFMVHRPLPTTLNIYNILGQKVKTLVDEAKLPGEYEVRWYGKDHKGNFVASGVYFYQLKAGDFQESKKLILIR